MAIYSDISNEFTIHPATKDLVLKEDELAVRQSIRNLINLSFADKPFHSDTIINLKGLLFENLNPILIAQVERNLTVMIEQYEPRVKIVAIKMAESYDTGELMVQVVFRLINSQNQITIDLYFDRIR